MHNIRDYGAVGDGQTLDTRAVQSAIDACAEAGGGTVLVPPASKPYVIGTIYLKDFVTLHIAAGAVLRGSMDLGDYAVDVHKMMYKNESHMDRCLIFARDATGVTIEGGGVIDGCGSRENFSADRPMLMRFLNCQRLRMRDITLRDPAAWTTAWLYCRDIVVEGITVESRANHNGDGLDFDGCEGVRVSNCAFDTSDDSICLQTSRPDRPCRDVVVTNCVFVSKWAGLRIGLLSRGDLENLVVSNCVFRDIEDAGLKIQMCEGAALRNMVFSNLVMTNVPRPIFVTLCAQRACVDAPPELPPVGVLEGLVFDGLRIDNTTAGTDAVLMITGMPGYPVRDVTLSNIQMTVAGGGTAEDADRQLHEFTPDTLDGWWPEYHLLGGTVPAHGVYVRHVGGLTLNNVVTRTASPDDRPELVLDDVEGFAHG